MMTISTSKTLSKTKSQRSKLMLRMYASFIQTLSDIYIKCKSPLIKCLSCKLSGMFDMYIILRG